MVSTALGGMTCKDERVIFRRWCAEMQKLNVVAIVVGLLLFQEGGGGLIAAAGSKR